jgi:hypothetical protein
MLNTMAVNDKQTKVVDRAAVIEMGVMWRNFKGTEKSHKREISIIGWQFEYEPYIFRIKFHALSVRSFSIKVTILIIFWS